MTYQLISLPAHLSFDFIGLPRQESSPEALLSPLELAAALFKEYIPSGTDLSIEDNIGRIGARYIMRLTYTSARSGRKMAMTARGDELPAEDGELLRFYLRQLVLTPSEVGRQFSRLYFLERRAKQDAFLQGGDNGKQNIRVSDDVSREDTLSWQEYA